MNWGMNVLINFLYGYLKFREKDEEWYKISPTELWIDGDYNTLEKIMKQQKVSAWLIRLIPCPETIKPLPSGKISYIEKGE